MGQILSSLYLGKIDQWNSEKEREREIDTQGYATVAKRHELVFNKHKDITHAHNLARENQVQFAHWWLVQQVINCLTWGYLIATMKRTVDEYTGCTRQGRCLFVRW